LPDENAEYAFLRSVTVVAPDEVKVCPDPECGGRAVPEQDGELVYWQCEDCGYEFDYDQQRNPDADACQLGIPDGVRRAVAGTTESDPVPVTLRRKPS
jgi:tRNA(Ile2) C34 agmatinyltransferase TiaS